MRTQLRHIRIHHETTRRWQLLSPSPIPSLPSGEANERSGKKEREMDLISLRCPSSLGTRSLPSSAGKLHQSASRNTARCANASVPALCQPRPRLPATVVAAQASISSSPSTSEATKESSTKEKDLVFIAGSTGKVGSRTVRELIKLGFRVRAGVRSAQRASSLVQSVQQLKLDGATATSPAEKLEIIECDLEKPGGIGPAVGNAAIVICCIGASEKEVFDVTGPYRIDYMATKNLVEAATAAKVEHFILVTSLGTNKIGFPAFLLNLFWGVLCWKRKAEEALISSDLPYTIVRPGGMERPTDAYKETHNLVVAREDTYVGGQVSNLQVAELIACMAKNRKLSYCKVVEVIAETTAPLLPMEELLSGIPSKREPPPELGIDAEPSIPESKATVGAVETMQEKAPKAQALSPYTVYEDLKPPSSPSPTPSTTPRPEKPAEPEPPSEKLSDASKSAVAEAGNGSTSRPLSPYTAFVDLKPPSSPSPSKPTTASASALDSNGSPSAQAWTVTEPKKQQPLSPYTNYEDLKPPSSPSPSAPKF